MITYGTRLIGNNIAESYLAKLCQRRNHYTNTIQYKSMLYKLATKYNSRDAQRLNTELNKLRNSKNAILALIQKNKKDLHQYSASKHPDAAIIDAAEDIAYAMMDTQKIYDRLCEICDTKSR